TVSNAQRLDRSDSFDGVFVHELVPGDYTLTVDATGEATGDYRFRLVDLRSTTEVTLDEPFSGELNPGSATAMYRFDVVAGDQLSFDLQTLSGGATQGRRRLIDPYG